MSGTRRPLPVRLIPRLDIKSPNLVKGIQFEGLRVMGDPAEHALRYYRDGADELLYVDIVASLYERNSLSNLVGETASQIFVPLTVGGGIRTLEDFATMFRSGADKMAINTAAIRNPGILTEASRAYGAQAVVLSIEAKQQGSSWEAYTDNGREHTGLDVVDWCKKAVDLGAGEILLTSVDREGTRRGFDLDLIVAVTRSVQVPIIACGGAGSVDHIAAAIDAGADAIAVATLLHYKDFTVPSLKAALRDRGYSVRL
jgi:cyclase